jgi:ADP-heptose:LPS heptosyltransferase
VKKKILLVRLDKIGDLICTLPVDQVLDEKVYEVTWVIQKGLNKILDLADKKRKYIELDKNKVDESRSKLSEFLKNEKFDAAISFQCPWWVNFEIFKAKIKKRVGVLSQWHSFLFLNEGVRQRRSEATQHEFDYNLDLVKKITGPAHFKNSEILFKFKKPASSEILQKYNLNQYVVVHPGMMGSALNWPQHKYIDYIQKLIDEGVKVVITGTDGDTPYLLKIRAQFENHPQVAWLQSKLNFEELIQILYYSQKVVAPSTGVAHIAASLDKDVHAIFSPIKVHHPRRWAPRGQYVHIYLPVMPQGENPCGGASKCKINGCKHKNCMEYISL